MMESRTGHSDGPMYLSALDCILENIPAPTQLEGTPQMLVTSLDYSSYTGRIAVAVYIAVLCGKA